MNSINNYSVRWFAFQKYSFAQRLRCMKSTTISKMFKAKAWLYQFLTKTKPGRFLINSRFNKRYDGAAAYWEKRYLANGTSGQGSYGNQAIYKANFINRFIEENGITSTTDFGCGDGNQLSYFKFPSYIGLDVSVTAIKKCSDLFKGDSSKTFHVYKPDDFNNQCDLFKSELVLSLDVIYHLVELEVFEQYMRLLFASATRFVIIYAWDIEGKRNFHVKHQQFTKWISIHETDWFLKQRLEPLQLPGACDFFIYEKCFNKNTKELSE